MTKKMIVLEGCDGSGKSTLAQKLSKDLNLPIADRVVTSEGGPPSGNELVKWMYRELADETPKIYDRFPIYSDPIYARAVDRSQLIGHGAIRYFHEEFTPFLILCDPGFSQVEQHVTAEAQMPGVVDNLQFIYTQYRRLLHLDYVYDHTDDGPLMGYSFLKELVTDYLENHDTKES